MQHQATVYVINNVDDHLFDHANLHFSGLKTVNFYCAQSLLNTLKSTHNDLSESCILAEIFLPDMCGPELQKKLKRCGCDLSIVFFSPNHALVQSTQTMREGAVNVLEQHCSKAALLDSVVEALQQHAHICQRHAEEKPYQRRYQRLTPRERQVFSLIMGPEGRPSDSREISERLFISKRTAEHHIAPIKEKMEVPSTLALIDMARLYAS
jgi:FixJ family two-component response regulator